MPASAGPDDQQEVELALQLRRDHRRDHRGQRVQVAGADAAVFDQPGALLQPGLALRRPHPTDRRAREVTITPKGRRLLTRAGVAGWTVETRGHRGAVLAMAYRPGTKLLATAGIDGVIRIWDEDKLVRALLGHAGVINALQWSRDGKTLQRTS